MIDALTSHLDKRDLELYELLKEKVDEFFITPEGEEIDLPLEAHDYMELAKLALQFTGWGGKFENNNEICLG